MFKIGFDNDAYLRTQSEKIQERIAKFGGKLYLEFGGKLFDDYHASRVLPGFELVYNKDKKYDLILSKAGDNILYAETKYDITQDVINGLNKRYKPAKKVEEKKADAKKTEEEKKK